MGSYVFYELDGTVGGLTRATLSVCYIASCCYTTIRHLSSVRRENEAQKKRVEK